MEPGLIESRLDTTARALLSSDLTPLSSYPPQYCSDFVNSVRHAQHDYVLKSLFRARQLPMQDEKLNTLPLVCERESILYDPNIDADDLRKTPDLVVFRDNVLEVLDVTITESDCTDAKNRKVAKYQYWRKVHCNVIIDAVVVKRASGDIVKLLESLHATADDISMSKDLMRLYSTSMNLCRENPEFLVIDALLNGGDTTRKIAFSPVQVDFSTVPDNVIERCFGSRTTFESYLENEGIFKGFTKDSYEDHAFMSNLIESVDPSIQKILEMSNDELLQSTVNKQTCMAAREVIISSFTADETYRSSSKAIPIPMIRLEASLNPKTATAELIESMKLCTNENHYLSKILAAASTVFSDTSRDVFIGGYKLLDKEDLKTARARFSNSQTVQYRSKNAKVIGKRTIRFNYDGIESGLGAVIAREVGVAYLDYFGKDKTHQNTIDSTLSWHHDLSKLEDLIDWFISETSESDDGFLDGLINETRKPLFDDIRSESVLKLYTLFSSVKRHNVFALADFYDKVYKEIAFLAETNSKKSDISLSSLGSTSTLLIVYGGQQLSRMNSKRFVQLATVIQPNDDFPFYASHNHSVFTSIKNDKILYTDPISVDCLNVAHHMLTKKFVYDVCLGLLLDSSAVFPLSREDKISHFFTNTILRFSNDKVTSDLIMDTRYIFMSLNGVRGELVNMCRKMVNPCRKELTLYFYKQITKGLEDWFDSDRECKVSLTNMDTDELATKAQFPRLLGPGCHKNVTEAISECYIYSAVSKEIRSRYHAMAAAFNKLTESSSKYYENYEKNPALVRGFSESSTHNLEVLDGTGLTTFSLKAVDFAGKLIRDSLPLSKVKKDIMTGKLSGSVSEFATNKSMVRERLSTTLQNEYAKSLTKKVRVKKIVDGIAKYIQVEKTVIKKVPMNHKSVIKGRARDYEWLNGCADLRYAECDLKSKAITLTSDYVFNSRDTSNITLIQSVVKKWFQAYLTLFPKNQYGKGGREIAIQDFETRVNNFFFEKVAESICKSLEEETISKASSKYFMQESISKEFLDKQFTSEFDSETSTKWIYKTFFLNEDHTRWGPTTNALMLAMLMRPTLDAVDPELFRMVLFASLKMMDKRIEIPKEIFMSWVQAYNSGAMDSYQKSIFESYSKTGEITFSLVIGMMQGIYNLGSSINSVARCKLARKMLDIFEDRYDIQISSKSLVGSDDKETVASTRIKKEDKESPAEFQTRFKAETIRSILIIEKVEECASRLLNMKKSPEKSVASVRIGEYNSNFMMDDSVVSRRYIEYGSLSSNCKAISYGSDVTSGFNGIVSLCQHGITEVNCLLFQLTLRNHLDSIYNFGRQDTRDIETIFECKREFCPIELGGFPLLTVSELLTGFKHNTFSRVLENGSTKSVRSLLRLLSPKNALMAEAELEDYSESELSSSIGLNYVVRLNSKVGNITRHFEETYGTVISLTKEAILKEPWLPFVDPVNADDFMKKMENRVFSFQSKVAFSYENDISNMIRMARMSSSKVCYIGPHLEKDKIKPEMLDTFYNTVKAYANESLDAKYDDEISISRIEILRLLSSNDSYVLLSEYSSSHMLGRDGGVCITRDALYKRATRSSIIAMKPISTKNKPLNVVIAKWYPAAIDRSRDLIKNKHYLDRDFEKISSRFSFIYPTIKETSEFLFGFSNEETDRASFNTVVNVLRSSDRSKMTLLSNVNRVFVDDEFLRLLITRNLSHGKEYAIVQRVVSTYREDAIKENYSKTLEQIAVSMSSGLIYIQHSDIPLPKKQELARQFLSTFTSSSVSSIPLAMTKTESPCRSFEDVIKKVSPTIFMSLPIHDKVKKALVCTANLISLQLGMEYEEEYQSYSYALSIWYIKEQRFKKKTYDVRSDCKVGITYRGDRNLSIETKSGIMTVTIDRKEWGPSPDITIPMKVLLNNTFSEDSCKSIKECLDKEVSDDFFVPLGRVVTNQPVIYTDSNRIFVASASSLSPDTLVLRDSIVKFARVITTSKIQFIPSFSSLVESNSNFSLGRVVEGRYATVYDITSQLFDPSSLISNGDRNIGILGEIETIFTPKALNVDTATLRIPLLASKFNFEPKYEEFRVVPENWDEAEEDQSSISAAEADKIQDDEFDLDFFEFETTSGNIFESALEPVDNDFADLSELTYKPGVKQKQTRQRVRFTESYCNIVRAKMAQEECAFDIEKYISRFPKWLECYARQYLIENSKQIINKYSSIYSDEPTSAVRSAVNRSISILIRIRPEYMYINGPSVQKGIIDDFELLVKRMKIFKRDCFSRFLS